MYNQSLNILAQLPSEAEGISIHLLLYQTAFLDGGSRISGKGVQIFKSVGVRFADCIYFFLISLRPNYLHFHRIFKTRGQRGGSGEPPEPPLDLPLLGMCFYVDTFFKLF